MNVREVPVTEAASATSFRERARMAEVRYEELHQRAQALIEQLAALEATGTPLLAESRRIREAAQQTMAVRWSQNLPAVAARPLHETRHATALATTGVSSEASGWWKRCLRFLPLPIFQMLSERKKPASLRDSGSVVSKTRHVSG